MKKWFYKLTGGRPMRRVRHAFADVISGRDVSVYEDKFGRTWLATHEWALFRVRKYH